ncbi:MAG: hypothetical protein LR015_13465 [Verrucomicrobia bacterium]|nr:hypothetical protein [Verrucomicrobiota bacterium]
MNSPHENPLYVTLLVVGSWLGNLLLTGIALVLAMTQGQPLTPLTFFTIAVCILLGNALPITVYYVNHLWRQAGLQAEDRLAGDTVRAALLRAEQLNERLSGLQEDAAKAVLVARQVPDRIENQLKKLDSVAVAAGKGDAGHQWSTC